MNDIKTSSQKKTPVTTILLAARVIGSIWVSIGLFFLIGSIIEQMQKNSVAAPKPPDILLIASVVCLLIAFCGLIIAWWRAAIGGFISFFGFIIAGVLIKINPNLIFSLPFFVIILLPSVLYLAHWWDEKKSSARISK